MSEQERKAFIDDQTQSALTSGSTFIVPTKCDLKTVSREEVDCRLQTVEPGSTEPTTIVFTPAAPFGLTLASAVDQYGAGLTQLADASDVAELKEAAGDAAAAISHLAGTVDLARGGRGAVAAVGPVTTVAVGLFGAYLDSARLSELRKAVNSAAPHVNDASELLRDQAGLFQESLVRYRATRLGTKSKELARLRRDSPDKKDKINQMANELMIESAALQAYAKSDPGEPFLTMKAAHEELANSLNNPEVDLGTVFAKLKEFAEQIQTLRTELAAIKGSA
jgi:hypothetical protein